MNKESPLSAKPNNLSDPDHLYRQAMFFYNEYEKLKQNLHDQGFVYCNNTQSWIPKHKYLHTKK